MISSGNLLADRRFIWARGLAAEGDHQGAADLLTQVIELVPGWGVAWAALAEARQGAGEPVAAVAAWQRAAALDEEGRLGAGLHAYRLAGRTPTAMPGAYVRALFDDYAPRFEGQLVEQLNYRGPRLIMDALNRAAPSRRFGDCLDLGCGTGLMGCALGTQAAAIDGVDLSPRMVEEARRRGAYRELRAASLLEALGTAPSACYELVTAADVIPYLGDLGPLFAGVARVLAQSGLLAFTTQLSCGESAEPPPYVLGPDLRFSHSLRYLEQGLTAAALTPVLVRQASARTESGVGVPGLVVVARRA